MPFADVFAPDINYVPVRNVYPTAAGGTLATSAGAMTADTGTAVASDAGAGAAVVTSPGFTTSGRSLGWWVGFLLFLIAMVWIARKAGGEEDFRNIRPTFYNFMAITLTAVVGIVGLKVIAAKYRVPGASDVILAV